MRANADKDTINSTELPGPINDDSSTENFKHTPKI